MSFNGFDGGLEALGSMGSMAGEDRRSGEFVRGSANFGFLKQDGLEEHMFVLPKSCQAFGGLLPPIGTRVTFTIVTDGKTGRPRAEDVLPEDPTLAAIEAANAAAYGASTSSAPVSYGTDAGAASAASAAAAGMYGEVPAARAPLVLSTASRGVASSAVGAPRFTGEFTRGSAKFGFLKQDGSEEDMFVLPKSCQAFGGVLPPPGTRVSFSIVTDGKTGRPRAEDVGPEITVQLYSGTMAKSSGQFGFIQQDQGGDTMFVLPLTCEAFGKTLPPIGTRLVYTITTDEKTGRPRAGTVYPEGPNGGIGYWAGSKGGSGGGGWGAASAGGKGYGRSQGPRAQGSYPY